MIGKIIAWLSGLLLGFLLGTVAGTEIFSQLWNNYGDQILNLIGGSK